VVLGHSRAIGVLERTTARITTLWRTGLSHSGLETAQFFFDLARELNVLRIFAGLIERNAWFRPGSFETENLGDSRRLRIPPGCKGSEMRSLRGERNALMEASGSTRLHSTTTVLRFRYRIPFLILG